MTDAEESKEAQELFDSVKDQAWGTQMVHFTPVVDYTTFSAEYAFREDQGMLVVHFFKTDEIRELAGADSFWTEAFPSVLSDVAQQVLDQTFPQLQAGYAKELDSWWLLSKRVGMSLNPEGLVSLLFDTLDKALENVLEAASRAAESR